MNNFLLVFYDFLGPQSIDGIIVDWFNSGFGNDNIIRLGNALLIILSLFAATVFGGFIGYQREINGHAAGFRTHILISLGSALIMILSLYGVSGEASRDPMRLAAAGVTGIGFLGAGSIIQNGFNVKGLTTAASIWVTMAIGMCSGAGYFVIGTVATLITLLCLGLFRKIELTSSRKNKNILLVVESSKSVLTELLNISEKLEISLKDFDSSLVNQNDVQYLRITFRIYSLNKKAVNMFLDEVEQLFEPIELKILN